MSSHLIAPIPATSPMSSSSSKSNAAWHVSSFWRNTFGNVEWSDGGIQALSYQPSSIDADSGSALPMRQE